MSITVAIPTHRRAHYLRSALASVASQTRLPDEVIVCEDGSDSETLGVVDSYRSSLPIVHIRNDPPLGEMGNRFLGLTSGESSRVAMLDDDDEWESVFLERADDALERHPECGFFSSDHFIVDQDGMILELATEQASRRFGRVGMRTGVYHDVLYRHLARTSFSLNTSLFRRESLLQLPRPARSWGTAPDLAMFLELGAMRIPVFYLAERLGRYRVHPGQVTTDRVMMPKSAAATLLRLGLREDLTAPERGLLASRYRATTVELAIGYAHAGQRGDAVRVLGTFGQLGWGIPSAKRLLALVALLAGLKR